MSDKDIALARLSELQSEINDHMAGYFASKEASLGVPLTDNGKQALERLMDFSERPGKRVRGALAIVGYEMFGGKSHQAALDLAVAIELIQNYLLIIDDVMDRSAIRRGDKTIHVAYIDELEENHQHNDAEHIGNMAAIQVGVIAQHMAADILARIDEAPLNVAAATSIFHRNIAATCYGQIEDLYNDALQVMDEDAIHAVHTLKNSYYTFINPLQTGAALAGKSGKTLEEILEFGLPAGVAFQLQDDIIGMFGDEKKSGKPSLDDLKEGKVTVLIQQAMSNGSEADIAIVREALGNQNVTAEQHEAVKNIITATGGRKYTQERAEEQAAAAAKIVEKSDWPNKDKQFIIGLLDYIVNRDQ